MQGQNPEIVGCGASTASPGCGYPGAEGLEGQGSGVIAITLGHTLNLQGHESLASGVIVSADPKSGRAGLANRSGSEVLV